MLSSSSTLSTALRLCSVSPANNSLVIGYIPSYPKVCGASTKPLGSTILCVNQ
ncbi:MAG: hypothetical protein LBF72_00185 [Holosporales bacterium]|nr:hypothetical protein [Holosporales bacterium]